MWWIALAHAELPWDCPTVSTPAEASPYRGSDAGAPEALDAIEALALAYWDEDCAWEFTSEDDGYTEEVTSTCTTLGYTLTHTRRSYADFYGSSQWTSLDVTVGEGESWTRITLETSEWVASNGGDGTEDVREATWEGEIAGFPADGFLRYSHSTTTRYTDTRATFVEAPGCSVRTSWADAIEVIDESVSFEPGAEVDVHRRIDATICDEFTAYAVVDGSAWGAVLAEDWSDDPADLDRDGYTLTCDCDEADPTRNAFAVETADDGVDQDCDGADRVTGDTGDTGVVVDTGDTDAGEWTDPFGEPTPDPEICGCEAGGASSWWMIAGCLALVRRRRR